jgi:DNA phosphorothioation-dependent restriction protein DptG
MNNLLDKISPNEALEILRLLTKTDTQIKKKIIDIAENMIKDIEYDSICDDVFWALDGIDVHELWDSSGSTVDGYISTDQMAVEMIEEELEPFQQEVFRLIELGLSQEAKLYCMGVLKGIYMYEHDSKSEFKDWATDIPGECFHYLLYEWEKRSKKKSDIKEMNEFLMNECDAWMK